jgi:glycogen(starch) synthase
VVGGVGSGDSEEDVLRVLMLGKGWFPDEIGGLDRYFSHLFQALDRLPGVFPRGVVVGPAPSAPSHVRAVGSHGDPLHRRVLATLRAGSDDVDVVDAHFALYSAVPLLTRLRKVPLLVHFHGPWADECGGPLLSQTVRRLLERSVYRRAQRIITLTDAFKNVIVERYGVPPSRVVVEPPGVDFDQFTVGDAKNARAQYDIPADTFVASCVRRLVARMGVDVLLDAWAEVVRRLDGRALLLVAGEGPLRKQLEQRAEANGLNGSVRFVGRVSDDELAAVYRAADVNVVPSLALEGFGLTVLEAAACGTPSVVTNVGGLPDAVRLLDASLVIEPGSPRALAARLLAPVPGVEETRAFAERYSWSGVAERHREHLRAVAGESAGRGGGLC